MTNQQNIIKYRVGFSSSVVTAEHLYHDGEYTGTVRVTLDNTPYTISVTDLNNFLKFEILTKMEDNNG